MQAVLIKKYSNNKLYIPRGSTELVGYITMKDVVRIIKKGKDVKVVDKATGEDLTLATLKECVKFVELSERELFDIIRF